MSKATAIHPDYFKDFRETMKPKAATTADEVEKEEKLLHDISLMGGWSYLKAYILEQCDFVDALVKSSMENGATYEEIGRKTIVAETTKSFLMRIVDRVENARDALENQQ